MGNRSLRLIELAAILAAALLSLGFHFWLPSTLPSVADHQAAAAHLAQQAQAGDGVLLFPWWTDRARLHAPPGLPLVGHLGSEAEALVDHPRIWLLSQPRLPRADRAAFDERFLSGRRRVGEPVRFGPLQLELFENGRYRRAAYAATHRLGASPLPSGVSVGWHEVRFAPRRCVAVALDAGPVELPLGALPPGEELSLEAGFTWDSAFRGGTGVEVAVRTADGGVLSAELTPRREGLQRRTLAPFAGTPAATLSVRAAQPAGRELCVEVTVREASR